MRNISYKAQSSPNGLKTHVIAISAETNTTRENSARSKFLQERQNGSKSTSQNTAIAVLCINFEKCFKSDISAQIRLRNRNNRRGVFLLILPNFGCLPSLFPAFAPAHACALGGSKFIPAPLSKELKIFPKQRALRCATAFNNTFIRAYYDRFYRN